MRQATPNAHTKDPQLDLLANSAPVEGANLDEFADLEAHLAKPLPGEEPLDMDVVGDVPEGADSWEEAPPAMDFDQARQEHATQQDNERQSAALRGHETGAVDAREASLAPPRAIALEPRSAKAERARQKQKAQERQEESSAEQAALNGAGPSVAAGAKNHSTIQSIVELSKLMPAARLEAYLAPVPPEQKATILMIMHENGWEFHDPEMVVSMLMGHVAALAKTIPVEIDAAAQSLVNKLGDALEDYAEVPDQISGEIADVKAEMQSAASEIRSIAETYNESIADALSTAYKDAAKFAIDSVAASRAEALEAISRRTAQAEEDVAKFEKAVEERVAEKASIAVLKVASDARALLKDAIDKEPRRADMWRTLAIALSGGIVGAGLLWLAMHARP